MRQQKDLREILGNIAGRDWTNTLVSNAVEKAAAYKLLKTYARLPSGTRESILPQMMKVAGRTVTRA